ncbi:MAG: hypothetical protein H7Z74_03165 [Anaerolineae bacterium]|nr:hypothetical protein [Gemmatimonadaceae bacterium]
MSAAHPFRSGARYPGRTVRSRRALAQALLLCVLASGESGAQLTSASAAALGFADSYLALASGADAPAWSPARLAMRGSPHLEVRVLPVRVIAGLHVVTLGVVAAYLDTIVPVEFNRGYVGRITGEVSERGTSGFEGTVLAVSRGRFAMQFASLGRSLQRIAPDPAILERFGDPASEGRLTFAGARYDVAVSSTVALSYAQPVAPKHLAIRGHSIAIGATVKYTVGHALIVGEDRGSLLTRTPLELGIDFPVIASDTIFDTPEHKGDGVGLDVGAAWTFGRWSTAVAIRNIVNTFRWNSSEFIFRPGTARFTRDSAVADFDAQSFVHAPAHLRARLRELTWRPTLGAGVAFRPRRKLVIAADVRRDLGDGLEIAPRTHAGVGVEYRAIPELPIRAGVAAVTDGMQYASGAGIDYRSLSLSLAVARRTTSVGGATIGMLSLAFVRR